MRRDTKNLKASRTKTTSKEDEVFRIRRWYRRMSRKPRHNHHRSSKMRMAYSWRQAWRSMSCWLLAWNKDCWLLAWNMDCWHPSLRSTDCWHQASWSTDCCYIHDRKNCRCCTILPNTHFPLRLSTRCCAACCSNGWTERRQFASDLTKNRRYGDTT